MKIARIATILLAGSLAFGLTACGEKQDSEKPAAAVQTVKEVKADLTIGDADAPGAIKIQLKNDTGYEIKALAVRPSGGVISRSYPFLGLALLLPTRSQTCMWTRK